MTARTCIVAGFIAVHFTTILSADETLPSFEVAKAAFQREMKKRSTTDHAAAVATLGNYPQLEAAELLVKFGFTNADAAQWKAARESLHKVADGRGVWAYLFKEWKRPLKKSELTPVGAELLRTLAMTGTDEERIQIATAFDDYLATSKANLLVPMTLIDELGVDGSADALRAVETLSRTKICAARFGFRRCIVQAVTRIRQPGSVGLLIELLGNSNGLIQADIVLALNRITGQNFKDSHREWKEWWDQHAATFKYPETLFPVTDIDPRQATYYGIPICAKRIVFVLDTSLSMRGDPIEIAKRALRQTIESLPEAVQFDVVLFDIDSLNWKPQLVPATPQFKLEAERSILNRSLGRGTSSNSALHAAFGLDPEVIYFLSDGEPTDARPAQIIDAINTLNKTRRVSIHTIGVVTDRGGGQGLAQFMQPLAEQNYGTFQLVQ